MANWDTFTKRIHINSPIDSVYRSWATPSELETWFLKRARFRSDRVERNPDELIQKDDQFSWNWHNWDFTEEGTVLKANGRDSISFTFGDGGEVDVLLDASDEHTEVTLTQSDIPTDDESKMDIFVGCNSGWTFWLTNLKAYLEHGITLHATGLNQNDTSNLVNS